MQRDQKPYEIIGAAIEVYKNIGSGLLEAVYHECLEVEFERSNIAFIECGS